MTLRQQLLTYFDAAQGVDHDHFDRVFTVLLLLAVGTMLAITPQYRDDSQLFPLVIGIPTFGLLLLLLTIQLSPRLRAFVGGHATSDLFDLYEVVSDFDEAAGKGGQVQRTLAEERRSVAAISLWTVAVFLAVYLVGFLPGILVFMLAYYRVQADQGWVRTVVYSAVMWAFVVVIFVIVLNTPFYTGVFDVEVPLPF